MPKFIPAVLLAGFAATTMMVSLPAQGRSTTTSATLDAAVAARPAAEGRVAVTAALSSPQAIAAAQRLGLSPDQLTARLAVLDDRSVQQLSDRILAGGASTVVISTTTIIIVLLIIILVTH